MADADLFDWIAAIDDLVHAARLQLENPLQPLGPVAVSILDWPQIKRGTGGSPVSSSSSTRTEV